MAKTITKEKGKANRIDGQPTPSSTAGEQPKYAGHINGEPVTQEELDKANS